MDKLTMLVAVLGAVILLLERLHRILLLLQKILKVFKRKKDASTRQGK